MFRVFFIDFIGLTQGNMHIKRASECFSHILYDHYDVLGAHCRCIMLEESHEKGRSLWHRECPPTTEPYDSGVVTRSPDPHHRNDSIEFTPKNPGASWCDMDDPTSAMLGILPGALLHGLILTFSRSPSNYAHFHRLTHI